MKRKVPWVKLTKDNNNYPKEGDTVLLWLKNNTIVVGNTRFIKYKDDDTLLDIYFVSFDLRDAYDFNEVYAWMPQSFILPNEFSTEVYEKKEKWMNYE